MFLIDLLLGTKPTKRPLVKILKVEDLKNDDIVERVKKELSQQLSFSKMEANTTVQKPTPPSESLVKKIKIKSELESKESIKVPKLPSSYLVLNASVSAERMKRFLSMSKDDIAPKPQRKLKCELPLNELKKPIDTLRCARCGILYERDILIAHSKVCQGSKRKTKFGCTLCSFTDCSYSELEAHVKSEHPKK